MSFTSPKRRFISVSYATGVLIKVVAGSSHGRRKRNVCISAVDFTKSAFDSAEVSSDWGFRRPPQFVINLPRQRSPVLSSVPLLQPSNFWNNFSSSRKGREKKKKPVLNFTADLQTPSARLAAQGRVDGDKYGVRKFLPGLT